MYWSSEQPTEQQHPSGEFYNLEFCWFWWSSWLDVHGERHDPDSLYQVAAHGWSPAPGSPSCFLIFFIEICWCRGRLHLCAQSIVMKYINCYSLTWSLYTWLISLLFRGWKIELAGLWWVVLILIQYFNPNTCICRLLQEGNPTALRECGSVNDKITTRWLFYKLWGNGFFRQYYSRKFICL